MRVLRVATIAIAVWAGVVAGSWFGDVEGGAAVAGVNDVRVPGAGGTTFSLVDDLATDPTFYYRFRFGYAFNGRHALSVLAAPLSLKAEGSVARDVVFNGVTFPAGTPLSSIYRFDSYRVTYRYTMGPWGRWRLGVGATAKVRDAAIDLRGGDRSSEKTNLGFVPLVNFRVDFALGDDWGLFWEGDALAASQGRAEDVMLGALARLNGRAAIKAGYRVLEGGADNDDVYNFALIHYAGVGAVFNL